MRNDLTTIDLLASKAPSVRVTYFEDGIPEIREYMNCYGFRNFKLDQVEVKMLGDPPNMPPRAAFPMSLKPIVENHGPQPFPAPPAPHQKAVQPPQNPLDMETLEQRRAEREPAPAAPTHPTFAGVSQFNAGTVIEGKWAPAGTTPQKQEAALKAFERDALPAEENPDEKKFLEEAPKSEAGPSTTDPEPTSVLPMVVTPSGRFLPSLPPNEEDLEKKRLQIEARENSRALMAGGSQPLRTGRKKHARPKQLPGSTLLVALVLSLSVYFRHPRY